MHRKTGKLIMHKETLRTLAGKALAAVGGGVTAGGGCDHGSRPSRCGDCTDITCPKLTPVECQV